MEGLCLSMAISPKFLEEIRTRVTLSETVGRSVKLVRRGREQIGLCPFHNEKSPSFTVSDEKNFYHCFGCGAHGDVIGYVMKVDGLTFPEAVEALAKEAGLDVPISTPEDRERHKKRAGLIDVVDAAARVFEKSLWATEGSAALHYLRERGLTDATIREFRLGFACPGNTLKTSLRSSDVTESLLLEAGLVRQSEDGRNTYDFFRDRVIFPICDGRSRVIAFGGRTLGNGEPKYLNSPDTPLFDKRSTLYSLHRARKSARDLERSIVTEGYMDVISLYQAGFTETVAPLGTAVTDHHLLELWRVCDEPILCFDGDKAGMSATIRAAERALPLLKPEKSLRFVRLPYDEDPDSLVKKEGPKAVEVLIEKAMPLSDIIWSMETRDRDFNTPERIAGLEKRLEDRALSVADRKVQYQYKEFFRNKLREMKDSISSIQRSGNRYKKPFEFRGYNRGEHSRTTSMANFSRGRRSPRILKKRLEQVLLAVIINHPGLLNGFAEDIASVNVSDEMLDNLRQEILKLHAEVVELDAERLKNHLIDAGNREILQSVLDPEVYVHAGFARVDASEENVRAGFLEVLSRQLEPARRADLEDARQEFIKAPTEENWERFGKLKSDVPMECGLHNGAGETTTQAD